MFFSFYHNANQNRKPVTPVCVFFRKFLKFRKNISYVCIIVIHQVIHSNGLSTLWSFVGLTALFLHDFTLIAVNPCFLVFVFFFPLYLQTWFFEFDSRYAILFSRILFKHHFLLFLLGRTAICCRIFVKIHSKWWPRHAK